MPEPSSASDAASPRTLIARPHGLRAWFRRVGPLLLASLAVFDLFRPLPPKGLGLDFLLVSMAPTTAVVFILLSLALGLTSFGPSPRRRRYFVLGTCLVVAYVAVHTLVCRLWDA